MKNVKSFLAKNFLILAFAIGGIFAVTSNVTVSGNNPPNTGTGEWRDCRHEGGSGIPFWFRVCSGPKQCNVVFMSYNSSKGRCYR